jgi:hypothetical protein
MAKQFCTQNYGTWSRLRETQAIVNNRLLHWGPDRWSRGSSYTVIGNSTNRSQISRRGGLSVEEIKLASDALHYIKSLDHRLWYAVVANQYSDERHIRQLIRRFKSDPARAQKRGCLPSCCYVEILEGHPAVHSNILFPLDGPNAERLIAGLLRSQKYSGDELDINRGNADRFLNYCSKERVTQARYVGVGKLAKRLPGSHPLGKGGGDRLRLSRALKDQLIDEGLIRPYRRRYSVRSLPRPVVPPPPPTITPRSKLLSKQQMGGCQTAGLTSQGESRD